VIAAVSAVNQMVTALFALFSHLLLHVQTSYPIDHRSVPTRRSSDLAATRCPRAWSCSTSSRRATSGSSTPSTSSTGGRASSSPRSEEHTSELQSRENIVCRLLLEKIKIETTLRQEREAGSNGRRNES